MKTTYLKNKLLEHLTGKTTYTKPANTYIGLFEGDPTVAGLLGQEISGGSYARQAVTWGTAANGFIKNSASITIPSMPSSTIKYWAILDASSAGNMLEYFPFERPMKVVAASPITIAIDNLILREE